jgi:hypothetical protein
MDAATCLLKTAEIGGHFCPGVCSEKYSEVEGRGIVKKSSVIRKVN